MKSGNVEARLFAEDDESCDLQLEFCNIAVRSLRSPDRSGPNEDAAGLIRTRDGSVVLAVADGVGGSPAGCVASKMVVETVHSVLAPAEPGDNLRDAVLDALEKANSTILHSGTRSASTVVVAEIVGTELRCYHVGDSELFVVGQRGRIKQSIIPHSPTGFAVEAGLLSETEAMEHDQRHVIYNVVGSPSMRVDISAAIELAPFDTVLLCSDGVTDNLYIEEIMNLIRTGPLNVAADRLLAAARARMAQGDGSGPSKPDDVTIVLYRRRRKKA